MNNECFINILGYNIFSLNKEEAIKYILSKDKVHVISGNPEVLYNGINNENLYKNFISKESFIIPDGIGTIISSKILKKKLSEKIAGIEVMKEIISYCEKNNEPIYLLGTHEETLKVCVSNLFKNYPKINICGYRNGFFDINNCDELIRDINDKKPKAIFIAMGCPRQEIFISKYFEKLNANILMGVGGSFDVIAEKVNRAPKIMISLGMEWAYRVFKEPFRIKRLGSIPKFLLLVSKSRKNGD